MPVMASPTVEPELFPPCATSEHSRVAINAHCRLHRRDGFCVVAVCGVTIAHFTESDRMAEAHAMVALVSQGLALQTQVARAFGCDVRTVRRHQRRFDEGGLAALGRPRGYPKGKRRLAQTRVERVQRWKCAGVSNREIARRLGVTEKAVRKLAARLGWRPSLPNQGQLEFGITAADPNLSAAGPSPVANASVVAATPQPELQPGTVPADPKLSALRVPVSFDSDPAARNVDRVLACMGVLDDAAPRFRSGEQVWGAGVLLAVPALIDSGVFAIAREIYGSIGPAFYGLRTVVATMLLMALLRVKRPEEFKEHSPKELGRLLGLDRAPEVKTLRRKLTRLAGQGRAADFGRALAQQRVESRGKAMGFLYVDGHVRAYHGKRKLPKTHVARIRLAMPASTDYWVNDAQGEPLFVIPTEANKGLVAILPSVLADVRKLVGDRRVTVVFDRGGWSPKLFKKMIEDGFDILTYRKGKSRKVPKKSFSLHEATFDGCKLSYQLADQNVLLLKRSLRLRQVTRLADDGKHQTPIITSRTDLRAIEVAHRMFERWRQENFFKYLRDEYALDALVDYGTEAAHPQRQVPNPMRRKLDADLHKAKQELQQRIDDYGLAAHTNPEQLRRTMRGFKIANAGLRKDMLEAMDRLAKLEMKRCAVPARVPVQRVVNGDVIKLTVERKHLTDILKMVAYQAEGDIVRLIEPHYERNEDEGRTLVQGMLANPGDILVDGKNLCVNLKPLSSPHRTRVLETLCEAINLTATRFPGIDLSLCFCVKSQPLKSLAFPGSNRDDEPLDQAQPDILTGG